MDMPEQQQLTIASAVRAGGFHTQHNEALQVRSQVKAGIDGNPKNHSETLAVKTWVKAGKLATNHNEAQRPA